MATNPLQQYFRQPKVYIALPSHGAYNKPGFVDGDTEHIPVFGMTGMDEIITKTPDALLTGESTVKVIRSCCPSITDPWELTVLDLDSIITAIRLATYGNNLDIVSNCPHCGTENEYSFDLGSFIEYYNRFQYNNKIVLGDLTIMLRPLTYKQSSEFALKNFQLQQQLKQVNELEDQEEKNKQLSLMFEQLGSLQKDILILGIESVNTGTTTVSERGFIKEWIENSDSAITDAIKELITKNQDAARAPSQRVSCAECGNASTINVTLDQSDFFVTA